MNLIIQSIEQVSKNIKRMVFLDESNTLKPEHESGYLKLLFTDDISENRMTEHSHAESEKSMKPAHIMRSFTIREVIGNKVTIDFVRHTEGVAYAWSEQAKVGDVIAVKGPGVSKLVDTSMDWFVLMGDMTALPAIAVNLKILPKEAKGYAIIEVGDDSDIQDLDKPDGVEVEWVVNADPTQSVSVMLSSIKNKQWLEGTPYVWVASEFSSAKALRTYFREEQGITKNRYISSYWKLGETDEGNKKAKKDDGGF